MVISYELLVIGYLFDLRTRRGGFYEQYLPKTNYLENPPHPFGLKSSKNAVKNKPYSLFHHNYGRYRLE